MELLRYFTSVDLMLGPFLDEDNGKDQETSLTITPSDVRISMNGGNFTSKYHSGNGTHNEKGWYKVPFGTGDTDVLGRLTVNIHMAGALPVWKHYLVIPQEVYDALVAGTDAIHVDLTDDAIDAIFAEISALGGSYSFGLLLERIYQMLNNKEIITDASGAVALRNIGDSATIATGNIGDDATTTTRAELSWS